MPKSYKILGQEAPASQTDIDLYIVPASTQTVISSIICANRGNDNARIRVAVIPSGQSLASKHYIEYDKLVDSRESHKLVLGFSLKAGDKILVRGSTANMSFSAFGVEITS